MSAIDLPPGIGLVGTPLGTFRSPLRARVLAWVALAIAAGFGALTWMFALRHPWRDGASTQFVLPIAFVALAVLGLAVRLARIAVTRDGVRWGWRSFGFHQGAARIVVAHIYRDGVALEAKRGSWWFLAARDWDRFEALVRQLRRAELPLRDHTGRAPLRARLKSYGRFLDGMLLVAIAGALIVLVWAS
jgi:hypothetical protein